MFDKICLQNALEAYKRDFVLNQWGKESYKWEAVKWFQDNWDINAADFAEMLERSLEKTYNLLASMNNFPRRMIVEFAQTAPEEVRSMFINLFDESKDVFERIDAFKTHSAALLEKYRSDAAQHFQNENAVSIYLWLRYPDKYYIYKFSEIRTVGEELKSDYRFKKGSYADNVRNFFKFYDEICEKLKQDTELVGLLKSQLTDACYPDPELKTLTIDLGFYISRYYSHRGSSDNWFGADYDPGLSVEDWGRLLRDKSVFTASALEIMKRMKDYGGAATCTQLSVKYGETMNFYSGGSSALAKRIAEKSGCPLLEVNNKNSKWWPILYLGRNADKDEQGSYVWKLRDELSDALDKVDLSDIELYSQNNIRYWLCAPGTGACIWKECIDIGIIAIGWDGLGDYRQYSSKQEITQALGNSQSMSALAVWQFLNEMKPGDVIFAKKGLYSVIGRGVVKSDYIYDSSRSRYKNVRRVEWTDIEEVPYPGQATQKTLTDITDMKDLVDRLNTLYDNNVSAASETSSDSYTKSDFLSEVYMTENRYDNLAAVLRNKMNIILQGAPGVGKTFAARRLAWSMMGEKDDSRIEFVQFHQNYSYEDFVMGYKPVEERFELKYGVFYRFCQKAANQPDKEFFFIIDEINRGNLSKIFGELLMLIEKDYRGTKATLAYNGLPFSVPKNLYIIGMMNTADRSLAMIDYALRRRFSFFEIEPGFDSEGFIRYRNGLNNDTLNELVSKVKELNRAITRDKSLGKGFCIGHSYFCGQEVCTEEWLHSIVDYDILPMLSEYWFDDAAELQRWENILQGVFQ